MIYQHESKSLFGVAAGIGRPALVAFLVAVVGALLQTDAGATVRTERSRLPSLAFSHRSSHNGNGYHNKTVNIINSPTTNNGLQMMLSGNAGGLTIAQAGFCKKGRFCNFPQRVFVSGRHHAAW